MKKQVSAIKKKEASKKKDAQKTLARIFIVFIVLACVLGFSLTFSFFSIFKTAEKGTTLTVDYTLYYTDNVPVLTSSQAILDTAYKNGLHTLTGYTAQKRVIAGSTETEPIQPVNGYVYGEGMVEFAVYDYELNAINEKVVGMHTGDIATVKYDDADQLIYNMSAFAFNAIGGNFSEAQVGMFIPLAFNYYADGNTSGTPEQLRRPAVVVDKTDDVVYLKYGYEYAKIQVVAIQ